MARLLTKRMADAVREGAALALLADIDHPDGLQRYWTGVGLLEQDGYERTGVGVLGGIAPVKYASDISIQDITFSLTGVPPDVGSYIGTDVRNRSGQAWLAAITAAGLVVADPLQIVDAILDNQMLNVDENGKATLSLNAHSGFYTLERAMDAVYSPEDQHATFANDSGCDLIPSLQQQNVIWTPT